MNLDQAKAKAQEIIQAWESEWPDDHWISLGNDWDLNLYGEGLRHAVLCVVIDGQTHTDLSYVLQ